jgi:ABC transporter
VASTDIPSTWLERLGVNEFLGQTIATLSFGQRKRLCTAAALIGDPWLLVFDEPSNGLDPVGVEQVTELIRFAGWPRSSDALCDQRSRVRRAGRREWLRTRGQRVARVGSLGRDAMRCTKASGQRERVATS